MSKILIVDGSNLLFQMFFGMPARIVNADGKPIHGALGFVGALLKIIRQVSPTHVAVLFDGEHENSRSQLDSAYKANRTDFSAVAEEENPFSQLQDIYAALDYLEIKHAETLCCEVDDWIAGYALTYGAEHEIVVSSWDSDFFQLITENVSVLRYRGKHTVLCTAEFIRKKYVIEPSQYADFKSLVGDASDNIKGAYKVGPKTAAYLLRQFGTLDNVISHADDIAKPSVRQSILQSASRLQTNRQLIRLDGSAPLPFELSELAYADCGVTSREVLRGVGLM